MEALGPYTIAADALGDDYWDVRDYYYLGKDPSQNYSMRKVLQHEGVAQERIASLIERAIAEENDFIALGDDVIATCVEKSKQVHDVIQAGGTGTELTAQIQKLVHVSAPDQLARDLDRAPIAKAADPDDETPEFQQTQTVTCVQIETIVGAKGLSADHAIVLGCDDTTLRWTTRNAFFVALTRAGKSLTLMACLGGGGATSLHDFVRALPDANVQALYLKAGEQLAYSSMAGLQDQLNRVSYVRSKGKDPGRNT